MRNVRPRLLCVGEDGAALQSRCAVLAASGYDATSATFQGALSLLSVEVFELVIVSDMFAAEAKSQITAAALRSQILVLEGFVWPAELSNKIEAPLDLRGVDKHYRV